MWAKPDRLFDRDVEWAELSEFAGSDELGATLGLVYGRRRQGSGHFVTVASTSALKWVPGQGVYAATKAGVRALCEVLRQEMAAQGVRATMIHPGFTDTGFIGSTRDPEELAALTARRDEMAMPPEAIAEAVAYAIGQPGAVDVGEITVRPTVQP